MFLGGRGAPRRCAEPPVADKAYLWLLVSVKQAASKFWKAHEDEIRNCCHPSLISETDIRGYLANDALGNPLLPSGYGQHSPDAVGKRVGNGAVKAEKDEKAARRLVRETARKVARTGGTVDADAVDRAADVALNHLYDLKLPGVARQHRHKTAAVMSPHELAMVGGETELTQLLKDAEAAGGKLEAAAWRHEGVARQLQAAEDASDRAHARFVSLPYECSDYVHIQQHTHEV